jgi:hypothetical protein
MVKYIGKLGMVVAGLTTITRLDFGRLSCHLVANGLWLDVCYFALQILQSLHKIYRQNNSTKTLLATGVVNLNEMFYLWKDKKSTKDKVLVYITDYKEVRSDGKTKIDNYGYLDVELVFSSKIKNECVDYAQKMMQ